MRSNASVVDASSATLAVRRLLGRSLLLLLACALCACSEAAGPEHSKKAKDAKESTSPATATKAAENGVTAQVKARTPADHAFSSAPESASSARDRRPDPQLMEDCNAGDAPACVSLGNRRRNRGEDGAMTLFQQACDHGFSDGCAELGLMFELGQEVIPDAAQAQALFKRACNDRSGLGCSRLAAVLLRERNRPRAEAIGLSEAGCEAGAGLGCVNLGLMHQRGDGLPQDSRRATELFSKACQLEFGAGCRLLGEAYAAGSGTDTNARGATAFNIRACNLGDAVGCGNAGVNYQRGLGVDADPAQAARYYQRACQLGEQRYCALLERFRKVSAAP